MVSLALPAGSHYAVVWGIGDDYAGMTRAMFHRSRAFVHLTGSPVTVLTYEFRDDYDSVRARLLQNGELTDGMRLVNLWEDLRGWNDAELRRGYVRFAKRDDAPFEPLRQARDPEHPLRTVEYDDAGAIRQVDYYREDGTLLVSDRRQLPDDRKRAVTLCDTAGRPIGTWNSIWRLYAFWQDSLPRDPVAWFIVDSKTTASQFSSYRRPDAVTIHLVHGSHLKPGRPPHDPELSGSRRATFEKLDNWDGVVFLTAQQRADVAQLLGGGANRYVCPNGRDLPSGQPDLDRPSARGVMLASLIGRKRVEHAIRAVVRASDRSPRRRRARPQPSLDIYGDGELRPEIEKRTGQAARRAAVTVHGFVPDAAQHLRQASFSLLTSTSEGQPLAIVESMAAGCIPVSYDIAYGPADVITHEVDGFLVPSGDVKELARVIRRVASSSPEELAPLRLAAHRRAQDFNDERVTEVWGDIMRDVHSRKSHG